MDFQAEHLADLPPEIRKQFDLLERRLWLVDTVIAVSGSLAGLIAAFLILFISDRLWDTPNLLRAVITFGGIAVVVYFASFWVKHWILRRRDIRSMARIVQKHYQRLGDRLLGIVELADEQKLYPNISKSLVRAAINQVANEAVKYDFTAAVALRKPKIYCLFSLILFIFALLPFLLIPEAGANTLTRLLLPLSSVQRFTFVNIEGLPDKLVVPHGEAFEIEFGIRRRQLTPPFGASCQFGDQPVIKGVVNNERVVFKIPGISQKGVLKVRVGDAKKLIAIEPAFRPQLREITARITYPGYLNYPNTTITIQGNRLGVINGGKVGIEGIFTREIKEVRCIDDNSLFVNTNGNTVYIGSFEVTNDIKLSLNWVDKLGLSAKSPFTLEILSVKDAAPMVELPEFPRQMAVLEDELIPIKIFARDDYGVKQIGVKLECLLPQTDEAQAARLSYAVTNGGYQSRTLEGVYQFSPAIYQLPPGSLVNLRATAVDYYPQRAESESALHRIYVLSKEEHAKFIFEQFEKIRNAIEELARQQENLVGETRQTMSKPPDKLMESETTKQIGDQTSEQKEYQRQLERLSQETLKILKEAMRNSAIPENLLKDWANNVEEMQQIASEKMQPAANSLDSARQSQNQSRRSEKMQQAYEKENEALQALQDLQQKMAKHLDKLQVKGLALRFRKIAEIERNIGDTLKTNMPKIIGLRTNQLDRQMLRTILLLAESQESTSKESSKLQNEVERFYQRTDDEDYGAVAEEMKTTQVVEELLKVSDKIRENVAAQSLQNCYRWGDQFEQWAKRLEGQLQESESNSQNGSQQQMNELDLEHLLALLRIRDEQESLIEWTSLLEKRKSDAVNYKRQTARLAYRQTDLRDGLESLIPQRIFSRVRPRLQQASDAMADSELMLRKPDTGKEVVDTQTDALNLIDDALRRILNSGQSKSRGANTVAQMMNMSGQGTQAGGNVGGNPTRGSGKANGNEPGAGQNPERATEKTSGSGTRVLPSEFREALQNYFNAIDKINP
ncbi:MAG: hypothetical protein ACP5TE_11225 [Verrucomicrobiia bacterium]